MGDVDEAGPAEVDELGGFGGGDGGPEVVLEERGSEMGSGGGPSGGGEFLGMVSRERAGGGAD